MSKEKLPNPRFKSRAEKQAEVPKEGRITESSPKNCNPFKPGTWEHEDYEEGFADAAAGRDYRWLDPAYGIGYSDGFPVDKKHPGRKERERLQGVNRNPYRPGTGPHQSYEKGFEDAYKGSDAVTDEFAYISGWSDGQRPNAFPDGRLTD